MNIVYIISVVLITLVFVSVLSFIIVYNRIGEDGCSLLCGGTGSVYVKDGECMCQCPKGWTGDSCDELQKGFFLKEGVPTAETKCVPKHGEYVILESGTTRDTVCGTCPDGYWTDGVGCVKCTDCDDPTGGKYFTQKCLNNSDAMCGDSICDPGEFQFSTTECKSHKTCTSKYISKGTNSYDSVCVTTCPSTHAYVVDDVCTKCTVCDPDTEIMVSECRNGADRVCEKCPPNHYVENNECVKSECSKGFYLNDDKKCKRCTKCTGEFVTSEVCGVRNNSVCAKRCPFDGKFGLNADESGNYTCVECGECEDGDITVADCEEWDPVEGNRVTTPLMCSKPGVIGWPAAKTVCPACQIGKLSSEYDPVNLLHKCQSGKMCSSDVDCEISGSQTGVCDSNGFCELGEDYYCNSEGCVKDSSLECSNNPSNYMERTAVVWDASGNKTDVTETSIVRVPDWAISLRGVDTVVPSGKIKVGNYESADKYDWGDSCYKEASSDYECILNVSKFETLNRMVCDNTNREYNPQMCEVLKNGDLEGKLSCGNKSCI